MQFTDEQLDLADLLLRQRENDRIVVDAAKLAADLRDFFAGTVNIYMGYEPIEGEWLSEAILNQVALEAVKSHFDLRHRYPHAITAIKNVSIVAFWIIKLKPINGMGFKVEDDYIDCPQINEIVTQKYIQRSICELIDRDMIPEFIPKTEQNVKFVNRVFQLYFDEVLYTGQEHSSEEEDHDYIVNKNNKSYETAYYMRYKRMTSINIYESIVHLLLPIRSGFHLEQVG